MGVAQSESGPQWEWLKVGVAQSGSGPQWEWPTVGVAHMAASAYDKGAALALHFGC